MSQILRLLFLTPALIAPVLSLLTATRPAHAGEDGWVPVSNDLTCLYAVPQNSDSKQLSCKRINAGSVENSKLIDITKQLDNRVMEREAAAQELADTFEMTEEESDTSVALFGCDCPVCVRSLRQLRSMTS